MTKSDLVHRIAAHYRHLTAADVDAAVSAILAAISEKLATDGGRAEIRGFGTFNVNYRPPRTGRNPRSGEIVAVGAKFVPHFKPGRDLRERVAASAKRVKSGTPARVRVMEPA